MGDFVGQFIWTKQRTPSIRRRQGFTLSELAIVLGIAGIALGGIWTAYSTVSQSNKANQAAQDILQIASNIRSMYVGASQIPAGASFAGLIAANAIPSNLVTGPASATNAWGGIVTVYLPPGGMGNRTFRVAFYSIPNNTCIQIASKLANLDTADGPFQLVTWSGADSQLLPNPVVNPTLGPISMATIVTDCTASLIVGNASSIEFDFRIN